jgi:AcrR family transcriptional regulator
VPVGRLTRERRRDLTRTALIEAAAQVFARRGFHGASLEEIADTAGFTRGAIYKNFADKEDLFFAVRDQINEQALAVFAAHLQQGAAAAFDARTLAALWQHVDVGANPDSRALFLEFRLYELRNPGVQARSAAERGRTRQLLAQFMRDNASANSLTLKIPAETLAGIVGIVADGFAVNSSGDSEEIDLYEAFLQLIIPATIITDTQAPPPASRASRPTGTSRRPH